MNDVIQDNETDNSNSNSNNKTLNSSIEEKVYLNIKNNIQIIEKPYNNNLGSLCELYLSDIFSIELLIEYLIKKEDHSSIDILSNLLFDKKYSSKTFFYLPQLCSLVRGKNYIKPIENYITYKAAEDNMFAVCANWIFNSYIKDLEGKSKQFDKCIEDIEMSLINGVKISNEDDYDNQFFINKSAKLKHFDNTIEFYIKLKKICDKLKLIKPGQDKKNNGIKNEPPKTLKQARNQYLRKHLIKINKKLNEYIKTEFNLKNNPFVGYILPFENCSNKIIINFNPNYSFCFSTKARVPIKLTFECINLNELRQKKLNENSEIKNVNIESNDIDDLNQIIEEKGFDSEEEEEKEKKSQTNSEKEKTKKILEEIKYQNEHPEEEKEIEIENIISIQTTTENQTKADDLVNNNMKDIFGQNWSTITLEIQSKSQYKNYKSLSIESFIYKSNDDLRQEVMTMQLIKKFNEIFKKANLPLHLHPYEIVITSSQSGLIEFLPDTISIDALKKKLLDYKITFNQFFRAYFKENFEEAQKNFVESLAAYSIISYLISIKDRHNGNILLDKKGNLIHIDFGFILGISPGGNLNFENAPFKLTKDYIQVMGGIESDIFLYFKSIFYKGIIECKKYVDIFCNIVEAMGIGVPMPCFNGKNIKDVVNNFRDRFLLTYSDEDILNIVYNLVDKALNSWRTTQYDIFQKLTNGIIP